MRSGARLCLLALSCFLLLAASSDTEQPLHGYSAASSRIQREWETKFRAIPEPQNQRDYMQRLSARPHHVGSPYDKDNAEWMLAKFKEWGLDANIETFDVLFPTPKVRVVELLEPTKFTAKLQEPALAVDPTSNQQAEQLPTYNAYSADGDVTAPLVYVNYGTPDDYEQLDAHGRLSQGRHRHRALWRIPGAASSPKSRPSMARSDASSTPIPQTTATLRATFSPTAPWRPRDGVQRGSVMDMPLYPGDPLTPGVGATKDAKRLDLKDVKTITKIPVLPISYADAQPLLAALKGRSGPRQPGAVPCPRPITSARPGEGPPQSAVQLGHQAALRRHRKNPRLHQSRRVGRARQSSRCLGQRRRRPDLGHGRPAWRRRARFATLLKQGWKPKRTIIYCVWDGEEPALLGSTEWGEAHADELRRHAVAYINSDGNGRGYLSMGGSHSLEKFINGVARDIQDPEKKIPVWKRDQLKAIADAKTPEDRKEARDRG